MFHNVWRRAIGMWRIIDSESEEGDNGKDYDEVILMTQYASYDHWKATRQMGRLGGKGPDWENAVEAIKLRRSLTLESSVQFLRGSTWHNPPYYMPAIEEQPSNPAPNKAVDPSGGSGGLR
jgi:hypothetical protein